MNNAPLSAVSQAQPALSESGSQTLPLAPLHLPTEPGLWPIAWGWWACAAIIILAIIIALIIASRYKKRRLAKKAALRLLAQNSSKQQGQKKVATANDLLRQVCFSYYPRPMLASLHGERWYTFLDEQHPSNKNNFQSNQKNWQTALYEKQDVSQDLANQLYQQVEEWITQSLPPSKKKIKAAQQAFKQSANALNDGMVSAARPANPSPKVRQAPKSLIEKERVLNELESKVQNPTDKGSKDDV
ncbi:DUF4381 domain-containing protein [Vibrio sp.]|uniref:DUF4381 domain-containing protein n=1 Tax=Vibrio sp. TaxID=678 RepID=UPI003AA8029B